MRARSLSAQGRAVSEPPERTRAVGGFIADRALGGALLFGYFLLGKQEKVTRSPGMASEKAQGRESVVAITPRHKAKALGPRFRGDDECEGEGRREKDEETKLYSGLRRNDGLGEWRDLDETHPHPTLPLKGRAKERPSPSPNPNPNPNPNPKK